MKMLTLFAVTGLIALATGVAADQWPRFRGPDGAGIGVTPELPVTWTDAAYRWQATLPGGGHSSPVVWGMRLFVTCGDTATAQRLVLCLDSHTGQIQWRRDFASQKFQQNGDNSYATATPTCDADGVVAAWTTPDAVTLVALDNAGHAIWRRALGPFVGIHGSGTSPIIVDDLVIYNNDQEDPAALPKSVYARSDAPKSAGKSFVVALDRRTGATRWQIDRRSGQSAYITPGLRRTAEGRNEIILASTAHTVTGVDVATGRVMWELGGLFTERCIASPIVAADLVIAGEGRGSNGIRFLAIRPGPPPVLAYEIHKPVPLVPTPLALDGRLYFWGDDGQVVCVRSSTGTEIWRAKISGVFYASPVAVNHRIYNVTKGGDVIVLAAGDRFELLGRVPLGEKCFATPAVANGLLYLRTYEHIFALGGSH